MSITALSYLGIGSCQLDQWRDFATSLLGMQIGEQTAKQCAFRMDNQSQRLVVSQAGHEGLAFMGWTVSEPADLETMAARLEDAGTPVTLGNAALCDERRVAQLVHFNDPQGHRVELVWSPELVTDPFLPARSISGFKTGALGMGHVVFHVPDAQALMPFYRDLLGFKISDYGHAPVPLYFFHVNQRHHSLAMVGSGQTGMHHFMIEFTHLDDVGQGYDLAQQTPDQVAYTLGRHTNDYMTSFYARTPSGFFVENGWGGRLIDPANWQAEELFDGPSIWGHDRPYLPPDQFAAFQRVRQRAAAKGLRAPTIQDSPWLFNDDI